MSVNYSASTTGFSSEFKGLYSPVRNAYVFNPGAEVVGFNLVGDTTLIASMKWELFFYAIAKFDVSYTYSQSESGWPSSITVPPRPDPPGLSEQVVPIDWNYSGSDNYTIANGAQVPLIISCIKGGVATIEDPSGQVMSSNWSYETGGPAWGLTWGRDDITWPPSIEDWDPWEPFSTWGYWDATRITPLHYYRVNPITKLSTGGIHSRMYHYSLVDRNYLTEVYLEKHYLNGFLITSKDYEPEYWGETYYLHSGGGYSGRYMTRIRVSDPSLAPTFDRSIYVIKGTLYDWDDTIPSSAAYPFGRVSRELAYARKYFSLPTTPVIDTDCYAPGTNNTMTVKATGFQEMSGSGNVCDGGYIAKSFFVI